MSSGILSKAAQILVTAALATIAVPALAFVSTPSAAPTDDQLVAGAVIKLKSDSAPYCVIREGVDQMGRDAVELRNLSTGEYVVRSVNDMEKLRRVAKSSPRAPEEICPLGVGHPHVLPVLL